MKRYSLYLLLSFILSLSYELEAFAAKKDFKGLFGSYRREKFTENEGKSTNFGADIVLSTLLPVSPVVKSSEDAAGTQATLNYATFFNFEASAFMTLAYSWEVYANIGHYSYETRKENQVRTDPALPLFHQFELEAIPAVFGLRYRLSREDIVPYLSVGLGMAYVRRKSFYDYDPTSTYSYQEYKTVACGQGAMGLEFFFSSNAGLRLEMSAFYFNLPQTTYTTQASPGLFPVMSYQPNVWSVRYASGVFFLF